jgi:hypothetical protein
VSPLSIAFAVLAIAASSAAAQRQFSIEATPVHGSIGYGWAVSPTRFAGVEVGIGVPQIDRTLVPSRDVGGVEDAGPSFTNFAHIGAFLRGTPASFLTLDAGARIGLAELDGCSGCVPGAFAGATASAFVGWRRVKFGGRLLGGVIRESGRQSEWIVNLTPFALLITLGS